MSFALSQKQEANSCLYPSYTSAMRKTAWIWFAGCVAWFIDGAFWLRIHAIPHAELAFMLALLFLFAGLFYRNQSR